MTEKKMKLATGVMPPSGVGRKPKPLNDDLMEGLFEHLSTTLPEEIEDSGESKLYPAFVGPDFASSSFAKDFQAQGEGRKYAKVLHKRVGKVVRVNVYHNGVLDGHGKPTEATRWTWRVYVPVSEYSDSELLAASDAERLAEAAAAEEAAAVKTES